MLNTAKLQQAVSHGEALPHSPFTPATLVDVLVRAATQNNAHGITFVTTDNRRCFLSYKELLAGAQKSLAGFRQIGLHTGDPVMLETADNRDFIVAFWGAILGGLLPVPIAPAPTYTEPHQTLFRLRSAWQTFNSPPVVTSRTNATALSKAANGFLAMPGLQSISAEQLGQAGSDEDFQQADATDTCLLLLTSGSTGTPKAVALTHFGTISRAQARSYCFGFSNQDCSLNWLPMDHVASLVMSHIRDVFLGCQQISVATPFILEDPLRWLDCIHDSRATISWAPNFAFKLINEQHTRFAGKNWDLSSMACLFSGGEAIDRNLAMQFLERLAPFGLRSECLLPDWGMSETSSGIVHARPLVKQPADLAYVEVGAPIPGVTMRVVDDHNAVLLEGQQGHIQVKGTPVMRGYYQNKALTAESFTAEGWLKTGDLGILREGRLIITGRAKDTIIINGSNYSPQEIESLVNSQSAHIGTAVACSIRRENDATDRLAVFIEAKAAKDDVQTLISLLPDIRSQMVLRLGLNPDYLIPVRTGHLPRTSIGKIQLSSLRKSLLAGKYDAVIAETRNAGSVSFAAPRNSVEEKLLGFWKANLRCSSIGIHDNFFDLGGNSLIAVRLITTIEKWSGRRLRANSLIQAPTVASLARSLEISKPQQLPIAGEPWLPKVFLIPPAGSSYLSYIHLARCLGSHYSVYALDYPGLETSEIPCQTITDIARHFIAEIQQLQLEGPYRIIGRCFGGLVAYEMAHLLEEQGQTTQVVMVDTTLGNLGPMDTLEGKKSSSVNRIRRRIIGAVNAIVGSFAKVKQRFLLRKSNGQPDIYQATGIPGFSLHVFISRLILSFNSRGRNINRVWRANLAAGRSYRPRATKVKIDFIMNGEQTHNSDETRAWQDLSMNHLHYHAVAGSKHSTLHHEQFAEPAANIVRSVFSSSTNGL